MLRFYSILFAILISLSAWGQNGIIHGVVQESTTKNPVADVVISIEHSDIQAISDTSGQWKLEIEPGLYNLQVSHLSYQDISIYEVEVVASRPNFMILSLNASNKTLEEVTLEAANPISKSTSTQSLVRLNRDEIQRLPGGVMDMSKVLKALPGVNPKVSFGYNFIVRGGGSYENGFFLDDIRIPTITHFNVQGLTGGPNGVLNSDLISQAKFNTGAFDAAHGNALSSMLHIKQRIGRRDRFGGKFSLGASEYGLHLEGPAGNNNAYILSVRKSYTEYLLKAFNVPVIPSFIDFQYHHHFELSNRDELKLTILALNDKYRINPTDELTESLLYNTGYIPEGNQDIQVIGAKYKHFTDLGSYQIVLSHDRFNNTASKFLNNTSKEKDRLLDYNSTDNNTRFQFKNAIYNNTYSIDYGIDYTFSHFSIDQFLKIVNSQNEVDSTDISNDLKFQQYGIFFSVNNHINSNLNYSAGMRIDGNTAGKNMTNPFRQFSPRLAINYKITDRINASIQSGIYHQIPPGTLLSYRHKNPIYTNSDTLQYMSSIQTSAGVNILLNRNRSLSVEGFYKQYTNYPFLLRDSISYGNSNGEYVAVGLQSADSSSEGKAYGIEIFFKQQLYKKYYGNIVLNYIISKFTNANGEYISSAWDSRYHLTTSFGKKLKKDYTLGLRWTLTGGSPYTPYDQNRSSLKSNWDVTQRGLLDYSQLNAERLPTFHQLDFRIDKKWYLEKLTILLFLDIQNVYNHKFQLLPYLTVKRDENNEPIANPDDDSRYLTHEIQSDTGRVLPTIGFSVQF